MVKGHSLSAANNASVVRHGGGPLIYRAQVTVSGTVTLQGSTSTEVIVIPAGYDVDHSAKINAAKNSIATLLSAPISDVVFTLS